MNAATGHTFNFKPFDLLPANFTFNNFLPDPNHRLHPMCNKHCNALTIALNAFLPRSLTISDYAPKTRASIATDSERTDGFMKLHNMLKQIAPSLGGTIAFPEDLINSLKLTSKDNVHAFHTKASATSSNLKITSISFPKHRFLLRHLQ